MSRSRWNVLFSPTTSLGIRYQAAWLHRVTGVLLVFYSWMHIWTLSGLEDIDSFNAHMGTLAAILPPAAEWLLVLPVMFHSSNGGRLILYELFGVRQDHRLLSWVAYGTIGFAALLGLVMATGKLVLPTLSFWGIALALALVTCWPVFLRLFRSGGSLFWKLQRVSGAVMLVLIPAHLLFMHLNHEIGRSGEVIAARMSIPLIKVIDLVLLATVLFHGAYGVKSVCEDYLPERGLRVLLVSAVVLLTLCFGALGTVLTMSL